MSARRFAPVLLLALAAGCSSNANEEDATDGTSALSSDWTVVGTGVAYKNAGTGDGVFIGYGGYSVRDDWACAWTKELHRARLAELGVGHLYCVRGPRDPGYNGREIGNSKLAAHLEAGPAADAPFILVAAHSSGHYVAAELFAEIAADTLAKIVYADLDGGTSGLDHVVPKMKHAAFVWAEDTALASGRSANASVMTNAAETFHMPSVRVHANGSGCHSGARWCLHDLVITTKPHDPDRFDLQHDYTDFTTRAVQTQWIDAVAPLLQ